MRIGIQMANVLVTGGAGFIGSHIAQACLEAGDSVWVVDNLASGEAANLPRESYFKRATWRMRSSCAVW